MKIIEELAGAFHDSSVASAEYLFSYRNSDGSIFDVLKDKIFIRAVHEEIEYSRIIKLALAEAPKSEGGQWVDITMPEGTRKLKVDRGRGKFLDIFQFYRFLSRRIVTSR
jgi:CRISPR/Cas system CMR subunit Cmr4 (Cas7 group RAMP superfamily)